MSSIITMQALTIAAITAIEIHTIMLDSMYNHDKVTHVRNLGQELHVIVHGAIS